MRRRRSRLPATVVLGLLAANLGTLWLVRGDRVPGWDLFGATYGVLALGDGVGGAIADVWRLFVAQRNRPVFTGAESFLYGLLPGLLNEVRPWLLWSHAVQAVLVLGTLAWAAGPLRLRRTALFAAVAASPALVSQTIVGLPHLASTVTTFVPALVWVVSAARRAQAPALGIAFDVLVFAAIGLVALSGYESGKTFFVVPVVAAVTLRGVPAARRLSWLVLAGAVAWAMRQTAAMTTEAALAAVPRDLAGLLQGLARIPPRYVVDWHLDFPALAVASLVAILLLRRDRLFWVAMLGAAAALVSLSAFQFEGGFLSPHRFVLLFVMEALVVAASLSGPRPRLGRVVWALLAVGIAYTTWRTATWAVRPWDERPRFANADRIYPLPYNVSSFENHLWLDRIRDARTAVGLVRGGDERHVFLYGFSAPGEDGVNPQLFFSRLLLPLGRERFARQVAFFDHEHRMFFPFPIRRLEELEPHLAALPVPFWVHVFQPVYDADALLAGVLNRSRADVVETGLVGFRSVRVDAWSPPGPVVVPPAPPAAVARAGTAATHGTPGLCVLQWRQGQEGHSTLAHHERPLPAHLDFLRGRGLGREAPWRYEDVVRRMVRRPVFTLAPSTIVLATAYLEVPGPDPVEAEIAITGDDEVAVVLNELPVIESLGGRAPWTRRTAVRLEPGLVELQLLVHNYWEPGTFRLQATTRDGAPLAWRCDPEFGTMEGS